MGIPGITPACAGNTAIAISQQGGPRDHPRLRGEYCVKVNKACCIHGITPACAGNTIIL